MAYWLLKTDPDTEYSWDRQVGAKTLNWDGVRNPQAQGYLRAMKRDDRCFFYHSGKEKRIVGIVRVAKEFYPDPSDPSGKCGQVDVAAERPLKEPVTLAQIKADPKLSHLALGRQPRLSVMPIDAAAWQRILSLGKSAP